MTQVYRAVEVAQKEAIKLMKPGVLVSELDRVARESLAKERLAKYFNHSLGHGVGLNIHEAPRLSQKDVSVLHKGMVITVEPGVYIPQKFGIRLEEMVLITDKGCEVISDNIH